MRAAVVERFAPVEELRIGELPEPEAGPGEVVVEVVASEVNYPDVLYVEGSYQRKPDLPFAPGLGGAGRIVATGPGVTDLAPGQRVLVLPDWGTHAERVRAPADCCFPVPDNVPFEAAAALGLVYQTAWFALVERGRFRAGERVLVLGATGGVGMAAVQLARALGAGQVIAATRGEEGAERARAFGADAAVDSAPSGGRDDFRDAILAATGGAGADIVIDPVGGTLGEAALRALAWSGRLVVVGFASGAVPAFRANYLLVKGLSVSGLQWTDYRARRPELVRQVQADLFDLWTAGKLDPMISRLLPLEDVVDALKDIRAGRVRGKVILQIAR